YAPNAARSRLRVEIELAGPPLDDPLPRTDVFDTIHLLVAELEVQRAEILPHPRGRRGLRNRGDALLQQPAQADLRGGPAEIRREARDRLVAKRLARRERAVGRHQRALRPAEREQAALVEPRVKLDLVDRDRQPSG